MSNAKKVLGDELLHLCGGEAGGAATPVQAKNLCTGVGLLSLPSRPNEIWTMDFLHECAGQRPQAARSVDRGCVHAQDAGRRGGYLPALAAGGSVAGGLQL
jgi:hypothetical protein